ncbi:hypothetical protein N7495_004563 [Penicillium taxi]|uniref:uncharacterized protein n=1 Tax=Penicillium taxi TaxID=168475 RepID=UPI00254581A8|nr:uncharacterized protein N7495_004563 [Penicillium taxi]KAJ5899819.1 hypothetical protein N7495_004563 [Penicillium taxi]
MSVLSVAHIPFIRFEKSLYDLIKGLRNHKGGEDDYIQGSLRECKAEIKSQDMDKKATALLKLIYLEMFGYDMSWASFHVLEVMSSTKFLQKRVGYLGAVQSFRPDTEVLMLATNMLKKDIVSPNIPVLSLPLAALPHIITPSLAMSLLPDILSRLSHSSSVVRKKTIVCLYRLALVYPEALKLAWPKIKEHLINDQEDSSVTTAAINVICELGWRRPHDFLPLAPRLFELLVDSGNNWMAIKIIKLVGLFSALFATLTPLEPRLTRKLLRPLTNIIQTTSAMSLLYECINGIIQGGILDGDDSLQERDEVATLCIGKLRGMIVMDSDPNLKYVALLALNRIVTTHPTLVSMHQDVIMDCLDDADISIRLQALDLAVGMVTSDNLQAVVNRLLEQLRLASSRDSGDRDGNMDRLDTEDIDTSSTAPDLVAVLPNDYRTEVIHRILDMCSQGNYSEIVDFEWYVAALVQIVSLLPHSELDEEWFIPVVGGQDVAPDTKTSVAFRIGSEIRNIAVRVRGVRLEVTRAAESLLLLDNRSRLFPTTSNIGDGILGPISWVVGEYADDLSSPNKALQSLIDLSNVSLPPSTLQLFLQAIPKVLVQVTRDCEARDSWKSDISLLLARVLEFLEALASHPELEVQERAIEFLEVLRLGAEAIHPEAKELPFLLSSVVPGLFIGLELNPVAVGAQRKVVLPSDLRLDEAFNDDIVSIFQGLDSPILDPHQHNGLQDFYYIADLPPPSKKSFYESTPIDKQVDSSYQNTLGVPTSYPSALEKRKVTRNERFRDDPFYIAPSEVSSDTFVPSHGLSHSPSEALDVDSIPIIDLNLDDVSHVQGIREARRSRRTKSKRMEVASDETFGSVEVPSHENMVESANTVPRQSLLLQVDSSGLGDLSLDSKGKDQGLAGDEGDAEMRKAMQNVEKMRLQMQRASERIQPEGMPAEGTLVKKKKTKKTKKKRDE